MLGNFGKSAWSSSPAGGVAAGAPASNSACADNSVPANAGPAIGSVVVVADKGLMTWNAQDSDGVASSVLSVDGKTVSQVNGPYATATGVNFSGVFGTLSAGNHCYVITATDKAGHASSSTGVFSVAANVGPAIGGVVVVAEQGLMTWNAQGSIGMANSSLMVDGKAVPQVNGPYTAATGVNFSGVFGTLSAGSHAYVITATDKAGHASTSSGTFNVAAAAVAAVASNGPAIGSVVVVAEQGLMTWNAQASVGVANAILSVDGKTVSQINGPYAAASGVNFSGVFGTLSTGSHSYTITATDKAGHASTSSGTFNLAAAAQADAGARSLAANAVLAALATKSSTSAKVEWLYDEDTTSLGSTARAVDNALTDY